MFHELPLIAVRRIASGGAHFVVRFDQHRVPIWTLIKLVFRFQCFYGMPVGFWLILDLLSLALRLRGPGLLLAPDKIFLGI